MNKEKCNKIKANLPYVIVLIGIFIFCCLSLFYIPKQKAIIADTKVNENHIIIDGTINFVGENYTIIEAKDSTRWVYREILNLEVGTSVKIKIDTMGTSITSDDVLVSVYKEE